MRGARSVVALVAAAGVLLALQGSPASALSLTQISTGFTTPIGIDHHDPTNSVIVSSNYPSGSPFNLERITADGIHHTFSALSGLTDELKIATARTGNPGGIPAGTVFTGSGVSGVIVRVSPDGTTVTNPWATLGSILHPADGLLRGSMYVDRTGVWGGDVLAVTTGGSFWRVTPAGVPTWVADVDTHLEGLISVPNDATKYGPLAGKAIAGAENQGLLYAFGTDGSVAFYSLGVNIEDIDLIPANENFFGVNFGTSRILGAAASEFAGMVGDILLTQESHVGSGLFRLQWDGTSLTATAILATVNVGSIGQWEHVTFSPAGIVEIPPIGGVPEPASLVLLGAGLAGLGAMAWRRGRRK